MHRSAASISKILPALLCISVSSIQNAALIANRMTSAWQFV
jgi:hypothetical protein